MPLIIKDDYEEKYPLAPEGLHQAVLLDVVDIGEQATPWGAKHKLSFIFEVQESGQAYIVGKRYTWSLSEKGNLRKDLERWLNKKFLLAELKAGIDLESLIGKNATLFITHNDKEERSYANIETILPPEKSPKTGQPAWYGIEPVSNYIRVIDRPEYQSPEEYAANQHKKSA